MLCSLHNVNIALAAPAQRGIIGTMLYNMLVQNT